MNLRGKKTLMITGALEIIIGLLSILGIIVVLTQKENIPELTNMAATEALGGLLLLYAIYGLHILAGLFAVIFADRPKHSVLLIILGVILVLVELSTCGVLILDTLTLMTKIVLILIPCYYLYGAILNYKDYVDGDSRIVSSAVVRSNARTTSSTAKKVEPKKTVKKAAVAKTTKKAPAKKTTVKKAAAPKKAVAKKTVTKKAPVKKAAAPKKAVVKKTTTKAVKKTTPKKTKTTTVKKAPVKKAVASKKKTTTKTVKKAPAKKTTVKKAAAPKKTTTKKTVTKKATPKKKTTTKKK